MTWRRDGMRQRIAGVAVAGVLAPLAITGCEGEVGLAGDSPAPKGSRPAERTVAGAREDLPKLKVAAEGNGRGYARDEFGTRWKDIDRNGCDQRNDVLARDLKELRKQGGCVVVAGSLTDPYSGKRIEFTKSRAAEVQIDHVYPLALAWRMGASDWTEDRREEFANDHGNLLAVWGVPNRQKSDSGPGEWKPQKSFQCGYAVKYVAVAREYGLPVSTADRNALKGFLGGC